jgi:parallel beta-helix repeat protein
MGDKWGNAEMRWKLFSALILAVVISLAAAQAATITVGPEGCDYSSIQKAVEEANPGDTISVQSGTFRENVVVDKSLILRGTGSGSGRPVVDGKGVGSAIILSADRITLEGFVVKNSGFGKAGIEVKSDNNYIRNNLVTDNKWYGISLSDSSNNVITGNVVSNNKYGIWIPTGSEGNRITQNEFENNANDNAVDAGSNQWDKNTYDDLEEDVTSYKIPGGSNVDNNPKALEPESTESETKSSTITVKITIPTPIIGS